MAEEFEEGLSDEECGPRYGSLKLFSSLLCIDDQDEVGWPSLQSLHTQGQHQQQTAFAQRETSKDSGIHEMTEEKRRSAKRKE